MIRGASDGRMAATLLASGTRDPSSRHVRVNCVVFLGKTVNCKSAFLNPDVRMDDSKLIAQV